MVESAEVVQLVRPRAGHFDLGTGYHGDLWLDLDALFLRPARLRPYVDWLAERLQGHGVDAVCGPLEGGALLAYAVGFVLLYPVVASSVAKSISDGNDPALLQFVGP